MKFWIDDIPNNVYDFYWGSKSKLEYITVEATYKGTAA